MFNGVSQVELIDVILAGKGGEEVSGSTSAFEGSFNTPIRTSLSKNYPNPFNPSTTINYELSTAGLVTLVIYDLKGSEVKSIRENKATIKESYIRVKDDEIFIIGMNIAKYSHEGYSTHDPGREKKLLILF